MYSGVMRFLQTEWHRHERDRNGWEIERQEMKGRIAKLEGSTRKADTSITSLKKYVNMLERALKERDAQVKALKAGGDVKLEVPKDEKDPGGKNHRKRRKLFTRSSSFALADEIASQEKPHNSFLEVEGDGEGEGEKLEADPDRGNLKGFMDKTQGELTYLMVSPSNPMPPREPVLEEILQPPTFGVPQQSLEEIYQQQARQKNMREANLSRPSPTPNHHPPPVPTTNLAVRNADAPARSLADQQPLPQTSQQEWSSSFQMSEQQPEEQVTKINHSYDQYGRPIETGESNEKEPQTEADGWNFDEAASFPEPETKAVSQRPDTDLFPIAQDPPKSPVRGPGSHRRKGSMSRRKSAEQELSLHPTQKVESGSFKVRFGLRGHLDAVRSVIFTGGGSPGEPEICTAGDDGTVKRWIIPARYDTQGHSHPQSPNDMDITSYFTHRGHTGAVMCLTAWSPSQNFSSGGRAQGDGWIFSGGQDATVRVWERGRVDPKATIDGHTDAVWTVCVLPGTTGGVFGQNNNYGGPDRIMLTTGAADGTVKVWSVSAPPQLMSPSGGSGRRGGRVRGNSMSSGSAFPSSPQPTVASNSPFHYTLIHSISRANSDASPTCITPLSASGDAFVVSYSDAAVLVYDTRTGEEVAAMASLETYNNTVATGVNAIVATTNGLDGSLSFDSGRGLSEDEGVVGGATGTSGGVEGIIISGHEDRYIRFYDANSGKFPSCQLGCVDCADRNPGQCTYNMLAHPAAISALSLSPDGRELVSAGHDASLRFWSLEKRSCTQEITSHRLMRGEGVCSVVWSQDGRWVVSGGGDGVVKVFAR